MSADPKRVFLPMGDSSDFLKKPEKNAGAATSKTKTLRLDLELFEPDEFKFPEFNYRKLVHIEKKKQKKLAKLPNGNHDDPFAGGDDGDVERIARELEAKYGSGSSYSKTSRLTTCDRGAGYDASDSFIDDTEAYDELIPEEIETDRGGFYINSGALEFKKLSNYERPGDEIRMPKAKKRALSTSSESSGSEGAEEEKSAVKQKKKSHVDKKVKTTATTSSSDEQGKAKKLKKDKPEKPKEVPPLKEIAEKVEKVAEKKKIEPEKVIKTTTVKDMLRAKRDNLRKMEQGKPSGSGTTTATDNDDDDVESESATSSLAVSESSRDSHPETAPVNGAKEVVQLPEKLPSEVVTTIANLKQLAETAASTKSNFFDARVMDQLVKIDDSSKSLGSNARVQTYNYMAQFMPCAKKTLFEKVRKHRVNQVAMKVKSEIGKLRKIVTEAMPAAIQKYENELKVYEQKKSIQNVVGDSSVEHHVPRKKFHWNDASRQVLHDLHVRLQELFKTVQKNKKETQQEFLVRKMREEVTPLWPDGWIKLEDFEKELERKKKKDLKAAAATQTKPNTANASAVPSDTPTTNGKSAAPQQKTEPKPSELKVPVLNGRASSQESVPSQATSVIKRSSDHSINSIISSSPSPPTTSKAPEVSTVEKFSEPPSIINITPEMAKQRKSESSDSDCVEIVGEFSPIRPEKSNPYHHNNNNKVNSLGLVAPYPAPIAKKSKKHGSDDGEHETDYSKIIMGIQSLTDPKKSNQFLVKNPLLSPVSQHQNQRKTETSHVNGTSEHFLDPKLPVKTFNHTNNLHYSIGDLIANSSHDGKVKSSDHQHKPSHYYNHQQQLTSSTNNNLHSISLSLTTPTRQSEPTGSSYMMPSVLNLSNRK